MRWPSTTVAWCEPAPSLSKADISILARRWCNGLVNSGTLDASGTGAGAVGGEVQVTGGQVTLASGSTVDASGNAGVGAAIINGDQQTTVEQGALILLMRSAAATVAA